MYRTKVAVFDLLGIISIKLIVMLLMIFIIHLGLDLGYSQCRAI